MIFKYYIRSDAQPHQVTLSRRSLYRCSITRCRPCIKATKIARTMASAVLLTHCLLDEHYRLQAAAETASTVRILTLYASFASNVVQTSTSRWFSKV